MATEEFEQTIESATGETAEHARRTPLDELRGAAEKRRGRPIRFVSAFPWIGRGNVLREHITSREEANAACDEALRKLK